MGGNYRVGPVEIRVGSTYSYVRGMRSFPHFSNWLGMTITGIEWKQSEVIFNRPRRTVILVLQHGNQRTIEMLPSTHNGGWG